MAICASLTKIKKMKFIFFLIFFFNGVLLINAQETTFNSSYHLVDNGFDAINDLATINNQAVVTGVNYSYENFEQVNAFVALFDANGSLLWHEDLNSGQSSAGNWGEFLTIYKDSLIIVSESTNDAMYSEAPNWQLRSFINILNENGEIINNFLLEPDGLPFHCSGMSILNDKIYVWGNTYSQAENDLDLMLLRYSLEGELENHIIIEEERSNHPISILADETNNLILVGSSNNAPDSYVFDSMSLRAYTEELDLVWEQFENDHLMSSINLGADDKILLGIIKINTNSTFTSGFREWRRIEPTTGQLLYKSPHYENYIEDSNNILLSGFPLRVYEKDAYIYMLGYLSIGSYFNGINKNEAYVMKVNANNGNVVYDKRYKCFPEQREEYIFGADVDNEGNFWLGGWSRGTPELYEEMWLIKTDSEGNVFEPLTISIDSLYDISEIEIPLSKDTTLITSANSLVKKTEEINIYPNPTKNILQVETKNKEIQGTL